ncbi:hypothetical protein DMI60_28610 [Escherichia coli]|nr:hypothetical protein [Escherichia coli]
MGHFAGSYGWRSSGVLHKAQTLLQRYMNTAGGYSGHSGDYSTGAAQVIMPHVVGSVGCMNSRPRPLILENSRWWCCGDEPAEHAQNCTEQYR